MTDVRPARSADRPAILRLQRHLRDPAPGLVDYGLATGGTLVSDAGTPVGYLLAVGTTFDRPRTTDALPPETEGHGGPRETPVPPEASDAGRTAGGAHLAELAGAPGFRRQGRATRLVERLLAETDGPVSVAVAPENEAARDLYRSLGFERVERRADYFPSGPADWLVER